MQGVGGEERAGDMPGQDRQGRRAGLRGGLLARERPGVEGEACMAGDEDRLPGLAEGAEMAEWGDTPPAQHPWSPRTLD